MPDDTFRAFSLGQVRLLGGLFQQRFELNRRYVMGLRPASVLQNHYGEAALWNPRLHAPADVGGATGDVVRADTHWGWEAPTCQLRGHFAGHWLSALARLVAITDDAEIRARLGHAVAELARCQERNGGEWVGSIPEKYMHWIARGTRIWAPHYTIHKTLMGLYDAYALAGSDQALAVLEGMAAWFHRWTAQFSREAMDDILDVETGGMLEAWANLYGATGKPEHLDLVTRYDRPRLFEPLLAGEDPLTNLHANTTIPEAQGAARAYEVTGEDRWRKIVEAYWQCAVTRRGTYATGGQTCGEVWTPPFELAARLGDKNQEHCTVYNLIRLAHYLLRWTGQPHYADYIERNLYNGILAQQHPHTGMVAYFLGLEAGSTKRWGHPTRDFWCCHGTLVQAHTLYHALAWYENADGLVVSQYIPSELRWEREGVPVTVRQSFDRGDGTSNQVVGAAGAVHRPMRWAVEIAMACEEPVEFTLTVRLPGWLTQDAKLFVNGEHVAFRSRASTWHTVRRTWQDDRVRLELPTPITTCPLPDEPDTVAFLDGPVVLAGLCDEGRTLTGDKTDPRTMLTPHNEREWAVFHPTWRARNQPRGLRFKPLYQVIDEPYTVYFPIRPAKES